MKTNLGCDRWQVTGDRMSGSARSGQPGRQPRVAGRGSKGRRGAFTLIELLVVISIMAILAAFTIVVLKGVARTKYRSIATAEMHQIETALDAYKAQYGNYPPSNANLPGTYTPPLANSLYPPLYYELCGVTNRNNIEYLSLDATAAILDSQVTPAFGVDGFVNCWHGTGEDATPARNFLPTLKANRLGTVQDNDVWITNLVTSVGGPDANYKPLGPNFPGVNPFRYLCPGTNNPNSYDLWVQLVISGTTNLICNWDNSVQINSPLP